MPNDSQPLRRFTAEELARRDLELQAPEAPRWYDEDELDTLYETNPREAMRISRAQAQRGRAPVVAAADAPPLTEDGVRVALEGARAILLKDGGDLELVDIRDTVVRVRLKGNCVGCPNSVMDLKNVVERLVKRHFPQVTAVVNTF